MDSRTLSRAWAAQAQALAEQGVVECRMCRRRENLDGALQLWSNGQLIYAICERCAESHDILITPNEHGIEVRGKRRRPYVLKSLGGAA